MLVVVVNVKVKPEHLDDFIEATRINHAGSVQEPGNLRFDVLQASDDPAHFILYEGYATEEDILAHKETPHYQRWRDVVEPWMTEPRSSVRHNVICPVID